VTAHAAVRSSDPAFGGRQPHAVQKALGMLEAVAQLGPGSTAKEIATFAGVPPATAYRMLNLLVADGYLVRVPDLSGFALGRRTAELAYAAAESNPSESLHEVMEDLRLRTRFGLHVASFAGGRLRFVDQDPDHEIVAITMLSKSLHANAIGKLMLAHLPDSCPPGDMRRITDFTVCDSEMLVRELHGVMSAGYAQENQETRLGRAALSVPIRDASSFVVGGLYLHGSAAKVRPEPDLVKFLVDGAARLTGLL